jgi:anti-anti-sigma factor
MARLLHHPLREFRGVGTGPASEHVVVRLPGEITWTNVGHFGGSLRAVLHSRPAVLEIDLGEVSYVSGDGVVVFFTALREARARGTRMIVTHVRCRTLGALRQLGLARVLAVYEGDGPPPGPGRGDQ